MAGLQAPLSTLRPAPRDALRMTRGQRGLLFRGDPNWRPLVLFLVQFLYLQEDFPASQQMGDRLADPGERVDGGHGHV